MDSEIRYARIPEAVLLDRTLEHSDLRVYAVLALNAFGSNLVWLGQRKIAELAGLHRRKVRAALLRLAASGHISCAVSTLGRRNVFQLNSKIFGRNPNEVVVSPENDRVGTPVVPVVGTPVAPRIDNRQKNHRKLVSLPKRA